MSRAYSSTSFSMPQRCRVAGHHEDGLKGQTLTIMQNVEDTIMASLHQNTVASDELAAYDAKCALCKRPCVSRDVGLKLRKAGLRCTRQRIELGRLLFAKGDRHFTADLLHEEARHNRIPVSL